MDIDNDLSPDEQAKLTEVLEELKKQCGQWVGYSAHFDHCFLHSAVHNGGFGMNAEVIMDQPTFWASCGDPETLELYLFCAIGIRPGSWLESSVLPLSVDLAGVDGFKELATACGNPEDHKGPMAQWHKEHWDGDHAPGFSFFERGYHSNMWAVHLTEYSTELAMLKVFSPDKIPEAYEQLRGSHFDKGVRRAAGQLYALERKHSEGGAQ